MTTISKFEKEARRKLQEKNIKTLTNESLLWYEREVKKHISNATLSQVRQYGRQRGTIQPGQLILYKYDPKTKEELPLYDTVPLVLVTSVNAKGWYGVAIHYLPPRIRTWLLSGLYEIQTRTDITDRQRMQFSWGMARMVAQQVGATKRLQHAIKQYLAGYCVTKPMAIDPQFWDMVVFLPLARFKKGTPY
jgi:hypothetical protein